MDIETFEKAKYLREDISKIESKMSLIRKMKERKNDEEFNQIREGYYDALASIKNNLENRFKNM